MKKFMGVIEEKTMIFVEWISKNNVLLAMRDGLVLSMPLMIVGGFAIVISDFPLPAFQELMINIFGPNWNWWNWDVVYPATMGLTALFAIFGTSYSYAKYNDVEPLPAGALAISAYFILLIQLTDGGFSANDFGAQGLFVGLLTALLVSKIYITLIKKKVTIKLPDAVPTSISRSFSALIPAAIIIPLFVIIRYVFTLTPYVSANEFIVSVLQIPLLGVGTSLIGTEITAGFFNTFFWIFGIHGTLIVQSVMTPIWEAAKYANLAAYQANLTLPYIATTEYLDHFVFLGGSGITLPLCIMLLFKSKSKQLKELGKVAIVPSIFNINEPIIYGLPIVMNPIMAIPFFITPMVSIALSYGLMYFNIIARPTGVAVPWTTPAPIGGFLLTNDWKVGALQIVILLLAACIYYPFFRIWDKKCLQDEMENVENHDA
ncbi:MAG: PTS sugar transporter subunit IIC [Anaerorhabdus sp.]|uniref:PTS sugar transporter subunit IIC n=1 Tax=Anaerorhabdus sp. TaxID=1872524 RepID=UPI002FC5A273